MKKSITSILIRYSLAVFFSFNFPLFYSIFRPITSFLFFTMISLFYDASMHGNYIFFNSFSVELVDACVAASAYLLLLLLNLLTPGMRIAKRFLLFVFSSTIFLAFNLLRLLFSAFTLKTDKLFFDATHWFFWFFSVFLVVLVWFFSVKIFKIKEIPFYSDFKLILKFAKSPRKQA